MGGSCCLATIDYPPRNLALYESLEADPAGVGSVRYVACSEVHRLTTVDVRPYQPEDRAEIRDLCHRVGYMGEPATFYWAHKESFAEIWTSYYTDHEPESLFVAVDDGRVVGYLTGCVNSRLAASPRKAITRASVVDGLLLRPGTARFLWRGLVDAITERDTPSGELADARWPSHLHINLAPDVRGCGAGRMLMDAWLKRLASFGSPGCHLGTLSENTRAIRFFEQMGFEQYGKQQMAPGMRTPSGGRHHIQFMVRSTHAA